MKMLNAFSVKMLTGRSGTVKFSYVKEETARRLLKEQGIDSVIRHKSFAQVLSARLGVEIPADRQNVCLEAGETALLCQIVMPKLAKGQILTEAELKRVPVEYILVDVLDKGTSR